MAVNNVILQGRIPFDLELRNGDDEKKAMLGFSISVRRNYKPEGEQYYPEDLLYCKAFGKNAKFINEYFKKGDNLIIEGEVRRDDDYTKGEETIKGLMYISVDKVHFQNGNTKSEEKTSTAKTTETKTSTTTAKKLNPFAKKTSAII